MAENPVTIDPVARHGGGGVSVPLSRHKEKKRQILGDLHAADEFIERARRYYDASLDKKRVLDELEEAQRRISSARMEILFLGDE